MVHYNKFSQEMTSLIIFLFVVVLTSFGQTSKNNHIQDIIHLQTSLWCDTYPLGIVYSRDGYFPCRKDDPENTHSMRERTLKGITLRIGIMEGNDDYDYDCKGVFEGGKWKSVNSYSQYVLSLLQDILKFQVEFVPSNSWSYYSRNNTGLLGLMAKNSTNLTICHWAMTDQVSGIADYLLSTMQTTESFIYLPKNLPLAQDIFVETFSRRLWIFFLLSIFLLIVSFRFSTSVHSRVRPDHEPWGWDEVVLWAVAAISQQSYSRHPRGSSCRTMFLIGYTITYLLYTGFAAGITSLLALQGHRTQLTFDDVSTLNLKLLHHLDEYYPNLESAEPKHATLLKNQGYNLTQIFSKLQEAKYVGFGSTITLVSYLRTKVNPTSQQDFLIFQIPNSRWQKAFLIQKFFPFKEIFNYWLLKLTETGLLDFGEKRYLKSEEVKKYKSIDWLSVDIRNVFSALAFLIGGWFLSSVILCLEIFWKRRKKKRVKPKKK